MERLYHQVKRFYAVRSQIIHGAIPDDSKMIDVTVDVFKLLASALGRILRDQELLAIFEDPGARKKLLDEYLFGGANW
ncbi:MAG TPA: hypothetical protein VMZ31_07155 [Phycisphaerae bacterium]|nr:hypothetical protein [Phycisphaerae bacterium]